MTAADELLVYSYPVNCTVDRFNTGKNCRDIREQLGLSLREAGLGAGIDFGSVSQLELGRKNWLAEEGTKYREFLAKAINKIRGQNGKR